MQLSWHQNPESSAEWERETRDKEGQKLFRLDSAQHKVTKEQVIFSCYTISIVKVKAKSEDAELQM